MQELRNVDHPIALNWRRHKRVNKHRTCDRGSLRSLDSDTTLHQRMSHISSTSKPTSPLRVCRVRQRSGSCSQHHVHKKYVRDLSLTELKGQRCGVILYTVVDGKTFFGLGVDSRTHDLTDFAGGVDNNDDNLVSAALREFNEETLEIFDDLTVKDVNHCAVIHDQKNLIIFVRTELHPELISRTFNQRYRHLDEHFSAICRKFKPEVCGITWLTWEQLQHAYRETQIIFSRVKNFLYRAEDFSYLL